MLEINKVYNCDCIDLMRAMKQQGIVADWLIADPPYGINIGHTGFYKAVPTKKHGAAKAMQRNYVGLAEWDNARLPKEYFDLMFEVSKEQIIFGGNYYTDILPQTKSWIVWDKRCGTTRNKFADCELAWCSTGVARVFRYMYNGMLQDDMKHKEERWHPTQKPTQIIAMLLNYYTKENDLVLDPFMGSFTTAIACYKTGRKYIGAEINKDFYEKGQARLLDEQRQISMFD